MKVQFFIICLATFSLVHGRAASPRTIQDDLYDFQDVALTSNVLNVFKEYLLSDPQVQELIVYIQSLEFNQAISVVESLPEYQNIVNFLHIYGVDIIEIIPLKPSQVNFRQSIRGVGVDGLLDDLIAALPEPELEVLFENKMVNSSQFKAAYEAIISPEFQELLESLKATPEYQSLIQGLQDRGVNVTHFIDLVKAYFGVHQIQ